MSLLESVKNFKGLNDLTYNELGELCSDIRSKIISVTMKNGGHLASSLGVVELTVALLRVFDPDTDKIIFDVGHQAYTYKILTGRLDSFDTMRKKGGIAGFPRMDESRYDFFTTGHSSTSISAAMGYAKARDISKKNYNVVAVIGDGSLINGVSFEALNCIESTGSKVIIILNDNKMSISRRIGGMASHLARLAVHPKYRGLKNYIKEKCRTMKSGSEIEDKLGHIKTKLKSLLLPSNIFEEMDISYWGPFNGYNIKELEEIFNLAKSYDKSLLIHVITKKGKGCKVAEDYPSYFHGISSCTSLLPPNEAPKSSKTSWSAAASQSLLDVADSDNKLIVCTAAMMDGTKLNGFAKKYPERFFDVGISEEHMLIFAAGMAAGGMKPAVCIYSTFLQRAADQVMHDICLSKLPVLLAIDRAGFVGEDGETHHGLLDVPWLRSIPEISIAAPRDIVDLDFFIKTWAENKLSFAVRYPRGSAPETVCRNSEKGAAPAGWGKSEVLVEGSDICLIGIGSTVQLMLNAGKILEEKTGRKVTIVDLRFIKPIDYDTITPLLNSHSLIITAEESELAGGVGEAIAAYSSRNGINCRVISLGAPDYFVSHASRDEQWEECGMTADNIIDLCVEHER